MRIIYFIILIVVALVFYLSWMPDPHLGKVKFIPEWLATWGDLKEFEDIRTGVPFIILGFSAGMLPIVGPKERIFHWFVLWVLLTGVVLLAEAGQLLLPKRGFSWADIGWGASGSFVGLCLAAIIKEQFPHIWKRH